MLDDLWQTIGDSELAFQIGATYWFPLIESIHVLAIVTLVGAIMLADLRILGWFAREEALQPHVNNLTRFAWWALPISLLTGLGLFISRPAGYAENTAFQIKLVLLLLAALNVWLLYRQWRPNPGYRYVPWHAGVSLVLWVGAVFAGRWIGHLS